MEKNRKEPDCRDLRFIVFLINSKYKDHDGKIFSDIRDAKSYAYSMIDGINADKAVIGVFEIDPNVRDLHISQVETIGFPKDKKQLHQLNLFKH